MGLMETEIAGHYYQCANRRKYRVRDTKVGQRYCCCEDAAEAAELCSAGGFLELRRNPDNHYDSNAVEVGEAAEGGSLVSLGAQRRHRLWGSERLQNRRARR